jgi:hypothetical protein
MRGFSTKFFRATIAVEYSIKFAWQLLQEVAVSGEMALQREHVCKVKPPAWIYSILPPEYLCLRRISCDKWACMLAKVDPIIFGICPARQVIQVSD